MRMRRILVTNDDGIGSVGLRALVCEMKREKEFDITVVAPSSEKSWIGKSISIGSPLELKEVKTGDFDALALSGTPADCVQVGIYDVMGGKQGKPDFVVSGINIGANVGHGRILSSGTVGAAMESSIDGVHSFASSVHFPPRILEKVDFFDPGNLHYLKDAAKITLKAVKILVQRPFFEGMDLVCINIPYGATVDSEFEVTRPYREGYGKLFHKKGELFYHARPVLEFRNLEPGTDLNALHKNRISITPVSLELVSKESVHKLKDFLEQKW